MVIIIGFCTASHGKFHSFINIDIVGYCTPENSVNHSHLVIIMVFYLNSGKFFFFNLKSHE